MSQRTKGNVKPSNSDRAARLLSSGQFVSFSQASQTLSDVYATDSAPAASDSSSFQYGISADFQIIFKHMTKKDINTKLKALQDFTALCLTKENDELLQIASYWYRVYRKLANVIDWRVRQEIHNAHFSFISKFNDRDEIIKNIQAFGATNEIDSESSEEISFQSLVSMPAIMWTATFDGYSQSADSANKAFNYLYPDKKSRIDFLLNNYDSILNYCNYCIFDKIPLKLFYTNPLPPDSVKLFQEHILVTTLKGMSSLVNELACFYLEIEDSDDNELQSRVNLSLEQIFTRLNTEFGKSKFAHINKTKAIQNNEERENQDEAFLSKKEKKKLKNKEKEKEKANEQMKGQKAHCKFWTYFSSENLPIRVSYFHALNSVTRLTSIIFDISQLKESSVFEQLNTQNQLWFKLYRTNLYESVFKSFADNSPDIRGFAWLLGTHMLLRPNLYKPWTVVNHDKWLQDPLVTFLSNGMRTVGGAIDFGLFNIGLASHKRLYPEFFSKKYSHLSGLQLTCDNYSELDILANVKLVIIFADAFNNQDEYETSLNIFQTFLFALTDAFSRIVLQKDLDFLVEVYFNLIYHFILKCLQLSTRAKSEQAAKGNFIEEMKLNFLFDQVFQTHLYNLLITSFEITKSDLLFNSQIYLNHLLLLSNIIEYYKNSCSNNASTETLQVINLFKFNVQKLYSRIFSLIESELDAQVETKSHSDYQLNRLLRFLNDALLFRFDGYFSSEFYYTKDNTNYGKNALKLLRTNANVGDVTAVKRVNFGTDKDDNENNQLEAIKPGPDWWASRQRQSIFSFSLGTDKSAERKKREFSFFLGDYIPVLDDISTLMVKLIKLLDARLSHLELCKNKEDEEELLFITFHTQYILRLFNQSQIYQLFEKLQDIQTPKKGIDSSLSSFVQNYIPKWFDSLYRNCSIERKGTNVGRFQVMICCKIYDILIVCLSAQEEATSTAIIEQFFSQSKPFAYCILSHHIGHLAKYPISPIYSSVVKQLENKLNNSLDTLGRLVKSQIEILFQQSQSKDLDCDILINLLHSLLQNKSEPQIVQLGQILSFLLKSLDSYVDCQDHFLLDFPLICREIYEFLFKNIPLLNRIDNFEDTLVKLTTLFFRQMFNAANSSLAENEINIKKFVFNLMSFHKFIFEKIFETVTIYEASLTQLAKDLVNIITEGIIHNKYCKYANLSLMSLTIIHFLDILFENFKKLAFQLDGNDLTEIGKEFCLVQTNFFKSIAYKTDSFMQDNLFAYLYELEKDNSTFHKLYVISDIFLSKENLQCLEKYNDSNQFYNLLEAKLPIFEQSLYMNTYQALLMEHLLENIYLNPTYKEHISFDLANILARKDNQSSFDILSTVRTLVINLYHFERFLSFYFYQNINSTKRQELLNICTDFRRRIETILDLIKIEMKKSDKSNRTTIHFIRFLISSDGFTDILGLSYANFVVSNFYPAIHWMDILNDFGLPNKLDLFKSSKITCLLLVHSENVTKINEIVSQALRSFESSAISESYSESPKEEETVKDSGEMKKENLFDWSKLPIEQVNQILLIADFAFHKLSKLNSTTSEVIELKERLQNFLTLLAWGKLENLFQADVPQFSHPKYLTFLLSTQLLTNAFDVHSKPDHFAMFLSLLKLWVQILYTSLPEAIETKKPQQLNILVMASRMLDTLNHFAQKATAMSSDDDSLLEMIEMWRNFLAFNSFNMLLPLFVVLNNSPSRNLIERNYLMRLVKTMDYVDLECLGDISTLELNQYLLMIPDENSNQRTLQTMLNNFIENAHLTNAGETLNSKKKKAPPTLALSPSSRYYEYLLNHVTPLLLHSDFNWSLSAFQLLTIMFRELPWTQKGREKRKPTTSEESVLTSGIDTLMEEDDAKLLPPENLNQLFEKLDNVTEFILNECEFGQSVMIDQNSDLYDYTFAYLLVWLLYLHLMDPFPMEDQNEIRSDLLDFLTERNLHSHLFDNLFHIMLNIEEESTKVDTIELLKRVKDLKDLQNMREIVGERDCNSLSKLALCVYYQVLKYLPNLLRSWFNNLKPKYKQIVDEFTTHNFSDLLIEKELDNFRLTDQDKFGNIMIRTSKKANEITAVYSLREISFGIRFTFKANYPLTAVGIECFNRSGVSEDRCRKWIHRLTTFFNRQNSSILNGIILLRPNMDKFFEGIEECMICLFVLYGATSDLPRFKCPQCRKKFHWACIRKWFQTNNNNICPQCKFEFIS